MGWKLFGKKKTNKAATVPIDAGTTIIKLREMIEQQGKREEHLEDKMSKLAQIAKGKLANGDKKGALCAMKKRKMYEAELNKIENVKMTLETQAISLEGAAHNVHTFNAMKVGNSAIASIRKSLGIDKVDGMMDDIKEEMELHREVDSAFAQPIDPFLWDDDDLLTELDALAGVEKTKTSSSLWSSTATYNRSEAAVQPPKKEASRIALFS